MQSFTLSKARLGQNSFKAWKKRRTAEQMHAVLCHFKKTDSLNDDVTNAPDDKAEFWMPDMQTRLVAKVPRTSRKEVVLLQNDGSGCKVFPTRAKFEHAIFQLELLRAVLPEPMLRSFGTADPKTLTLHFAALPGSKPICQDAVYERRAYGQTFRVATQASFGTQIFTPQTDYAALAKELGSRSGNANHLVESLLCGAVAQYLVGAGDISMLDFAVVPDRSGLCMFDAADPAADDFRKPVKPFVDELWARPLQRTCSLRAFLEGFLQSDGGLQSARDIVLRHEQGLADALKQRRDDPCCDYYDRASRVMQRSCRLLASLSLSGGGGAAPSSVYFAVN